MRPLMTLIHIFNCTQLQHEPTTCTHTLTLISCIIQRSRTLALLHIPLHISHWSNYYLGAIPPLGAFSPSTSTSGIEAIPGKDARVGRGRSCKTGSLEVVDRSCTPKWAAKSSRHLHARIMVTRDGSYGVGVLYVVSYLSRIKPYYTNCSVKYDFGHLTNFAATSPAEPPRGTPSPSERSMITCLLLPQPRRWCM